jgi:hypothetical protein
MRRIFVVRMLVYGVNPFWLTHLRVLLWCRVSSTLLDNSWFCVLYALLMALVISAVSASAPLDGTRARHGGASKGAAGIIIILAPRFIFTLFARFISSEGTGVVACK